MIPGRQMGRSRAVARAVAKNAGIPPEVFDKFWDEYERDERVRKGEYGATLTRYVNPEVTKAFEEMDKENDGKEENQKTENTKL